MISREAPQKINTIERPNFMRSCTIYSAKLWSVEERIGEGNVYEQARLLTKLNRLSPRISRSHNYETRVTNVPHLFDSISIRHRNISTRHREIYSFSSRCDVSGILAYVPCAHLSPPIPASNAANHDEDCSIVRLVSDMTFVVRNAISDAVIVAGHLKERGY